MLAGVQAGDLLVAVNGTPVAGNTSRDLNTAVSLLKGDDQTPVEATFERNGERLTFTLMRGAVNINYVEYSVLDGDIGYLSIYQFSGDDVAGVTEALSAFREAGVRALVVDVRSNPGGLLSDVVQICDLLVPEGMIVYTEDRQGRRQEYYADGEYWDVPMAVLVNGMSASASEIFRRRRSGKRPRRNRGRNHLRQGHCANAVLLCRGRRRATDHLRLLHRLRRFHPWPGRHPGY